jgi:hypothetical protein
MDTGLSRLISDYHARVGEAIAVLAKAGIERPVSAADWAALDVPQRAELPGGFQYFKHGFGCAVHSPSWIINFDFGDNGEIDGFTGQSLCGFAGERLSEYGFESEKEVERAIKIAVELNAIRFSGYILYFLRSPDSKGPANKTLQPTSGA